jgi:hypothetical protein
VLSAQDGAGSGVPCPAALTVLSSALTYQRTRPIHPSAWNKSSANFAMKLSEESQRIPKCGLTGNRGGTVQSVLTRSTTKIHARSATQTPFQTVSGKRSRKLATRWQLARSTTDGVPLSDGGAVALSMSLLARLRTRPGTSPTPPPTPCRLLAERGPAGSLRPGPRPGRGARRPSSPRRTGS